MQQPKRTAQECFNLYRMAFEQLSPEQRTTLKVLPATFEELSQEEQAIFQAMAWRGNLIMSEFEVARSES